MTSNLEKSRKRTKNNRTPSPNMKEKLLTRFPFGKTEVQPTLKSKSKIPIRSKSRMKSKSKPKTTGRLNADKDKVQEYKNKLENYQTYMRETLHEIMKSDGINREELGKIINRFETIASREKEEIGKLMFRNDQNEIDHTSENDMEEILNDLSSPESSKEGNLLGDGFLHQKRKHENEARFFAMDPVTAFNTTPGINIENPANLQSNKDKFPKKLIVKKINRKISKSDKKSGEDSQAKTAANVFFHNQLDHFINQGMKMKKKSKPITNESSFSRRKEYAMNLMNLKKKYIKMDENTLKKVNESQEIKDNNFYIGSISDMHVTKEFKKNAEKNKIVVSKGMVREKANAFVRLINDANMRKKYIPKNTNKTKVPVFKC